jgi:anti-anti-sigma factor
MHRRPHRIIEERPRRWNASMTAISEHPPFSDEARAEFVLTERRLRCCAVLLVRGEIDIATVEQLERTGTRLLEDADGRLVLDLSETTFMDLSGVRATERLSRLASDTGGSLVVIAVTPGVRRILALAAHPWLAVTGDLDTALETVSDRAGALS